MTIGAVLLVRHGESTWNAQRRWQGRADPPLSERGERQAVTAASQAAMIAQFGEVVTSTLRRARRTGELLAEHLGVRLGSAELDLVERSAGQWEGLTRVEIDERYPGYLTEGRRPVGYEPDADVVARSRAALLSLVDAAGEALAPLLVVTHGGVINALERHAREEFRRFDNLEGRWFDVDLDARSVEPIGTRVHLLDDAIESHDHGASSTPDPGYA